MHAACLLHLLKAEELDNGKVHTRVKPQTALVWADCLVELHAESTVHLDVACGIWIRGDEKGLQSTSREDRVTIKLRKVSVGL